MTHILTAKPPMYEEAKETFNFSEDTVIFFAYGDCIYNPSGAQITDDLIVHEETHLEQQAGSREVANLWWQRYLVDPEWRVEQEAEAYGAQYAFIRRVVKDRNNQTKNLYKMAQALSGPLYGNVIKHSEAMSKILEYANMGKTLLDSK